MNIQRLKKGKVNRLVGESGIMVSMTNNWFKVAALFMMVGVILGAFGAHALKSRLSPEALDIYKTAVFYQFVHAVGIFVVAFASVGASGPNHILTFAGISFTIGILIFSGSLYLLALTGIRWIGAFTPLGGLAFILGWGFLLFSE